MSIQKAVRCGAVLLFVSFLSGCSLLDFGKSEDEPVEVPYNACQHDPKSCMYEGSYEVGERDFAIQEAKRLNKASMERLMRSAANL